MAETEKVRISREIDAKIHGMARDYYQEGKKAGREKMPELRTMVSGKLDDGTDTSLMVKILPNPINPRLAGGWRVVAEDKVWQIDPDMLEKSRLL